MSLQVDEGGRRGRSRSPSGRERSSTRLARSPSGRERDAVEVIQAPYPAGGDDDDLNRHSSTRILDYDDYRGSSAKASSHDPADNPSYRKARYDAVDVKYSDGRREKSYRYEADTKRDRDRSPGRDRDWASKQAEDPRSAQDDKFAYLPAKYAKPATDRERKRDKKDDQEHPRSGDAYGREYGQPERAPAGRDDRERLRPALKRGEEISDEEDDSDVNDDDDDANLTYGSGPVPAKSALKRAPSSRMYAGSDARGPAKTGRYPYAEEKGHDDDAWREPLIVHAEPRDRQDSRDDRDTRDRKTHRSSRESVDLRGSRNLRDPRSSRESYDTRDDRKPRDGDAHASSNSLLAPGEGQPRTRERLRSRSRSPMPTKDMARLSVNTLSVDTPRHGSRLSVSAAPGSPLLESYHGTYQSMSPMPSPLLLASDGPRSSGMLDMQTMDLNGYGLDGDGDDGPASMGSGSGGGDKIRRRARFYDPEADAARLAKALRGERHPPDTGPLIEILPGLTHAQVIELRAEYKRLVKTGPERKGVNLAKHIRARLKDEDSALMKACYATALGQWESEAYWANFWYHGDKTRRELLIESLMGRTNDEIHRIKESFSDKKYSDSITKCMRTELKEDKFKRAILFVLDEQRMEEVGRDGRPLAVDWSLVEEDVATLHHAVRAEKGGETAMINVVVQRSDTHLREVLRTYSSQYKSNFARDCLKKSGNLVGEMLAHILNGVINKPVRDALLVHHALTASKRDGLRRELLISRLVRYHWDRHHMAAIKAAYRDRYSRDMQEAIRDATGNSDWGLFCGELCITRHPDEVKRVERIEIRHEERRG